MEKKNDLVLSLEFGRVEGGANIGLPSFFIDFTGKGGEMTDMADVLYELQHHGGSFSKTAFFRGVFSEENEDEIQVLIASLKNYGWTILASTDPFTYRPWFTRAVRVGGTLLPGLDWLRVEMINDLNWTPFWCNEFVYFNDSPEGEPVLPNDPNNLIRYYVEGEDEEKVWEFLKKAQRKWRFFK
jgi:hypothetical protein